jgi:hypothetical protein
MKLVSCFCFQKIIQGQTFGITIQPLDSASRELVMSLNWQYFAVQCHCVFSGVPVPSVSVSSLPGSP